MQLQKKTEGKFLQSLQWETGEKDGERRYLRAERKPFLP